MAHSSKAQKRFFFKGFAFIFYNSESSSPTKQLVVDLETRSLRKEFVFLENFEFQAASQLKQGLCVIIASRTCFLLNLDEILESEKEEVRCKKIPLPDEAQIKKQLIDCCILDDRLVVMTFSKHNYGVQIFHCNLSSAIANSAKFPQVAWMKVSIFKTLEDPAESFHRLEVRPISNFYYTRLDNVSMATSRPVTSLTFWGRQLLAKVRTKKRS